MKLVDWIYDIKKKTYINVFYTWLNIRGKALKNQKFSILCNNCMGGRIYHQLHKRFTSPTINLWIGEDDFVRFLFHPEDYLEQDLRFFSDGIKPYPRAHLGDITINFQHYKSEEEAKDAWMRRKERIIWDHIYAIIYAQNGISESDYTALKELKLYKRVAVVGAANCRGFITDGLKFRDKKQNWMTKENGVRIYERDFNYISFLNERRHI